MDENFYNREKLVFLFWLEVYTKQCLFYLGGNVEIGFWGEIQGDWMALDFGLDFWCDRFLLHCFFHLHTPSDSRFYDSQK